MTTPHILLVEDSNFMATKVVETLESAHEFVITTVSTAVEARSALQNGSYDCIISNYELPDESGVELAESLRGDDSIPSVPLIILTGRSLEPLAKDAIEAGVTEFVYKGDQATGDMDVLANRVRIVLQAHRETSTTEVDS
ncbi:CheY-like chemotaxis protein [Halohasta litchfieldiae]|jgi:DNA-binding response OmpR family regulator|uniref:CheY chemotaxis protein or a CheY-like REC (Receiver) domain n=1 Tax=Halohasta litchfieldiae TaxID=1073996 RepID=A0A1H6TGL7_9EURY|nr:response regulator [Halohasta litchfieldiae]ATW87669.1 CheY-like chemotaxis protein [Halohasta litchfieldiae]SEI76267.1 CheY chemotaxis protein or a CheY-like REC (receiver) domain [Halohasta litchfieldiae]